MSKYLLVTFNFEGKSPPNESLKTEFDRAKDWIRITPTSWILWTSTDEETWGKRLRSIVDSSASIVIAEINLEKFYGFLPDSIWKWIKKRRA